MNREKIEAIVSYLKGEQVGGAWNNMRRDSARYVLPNNPSEEDGVYLFSKYTGRKVFCSDDAKVVVLTAHRKNGHMSSLPLHHLLTTQLQVEVSRRFIQKVLRDCKICNTVPGRKHPKVVQIPLPVEHGPFSRIQVDLIELTGQVSILGHTHVMVIVDCFTKYTWTYPMISKTAEQATYFINLWITQYGVPGLFHTDNGTEFTNEDVTVLLEECEASVVRGRERHPSSQGKVEAVNKSLKRTLTRMSLDRDEDWIFLLDECTTIRRIPASEWLHLKHFMAFRKSLLGPGRLRAEKDTLQRRQQWWKDGRNTRAEEQIFVFLSLNNLRRPDRG